MVTITNLETQLVAKIAALDGSQTIKELMILKKSAENTAVDITALDARIDTYIAALSGASTDTDLLLSNKSAGLSDPAPAASSPIASIQRGFTTKPASANFIDVNISPVNTTKTVCNHAGYTHSFSNETRLSTTIQLVNSSTLRITSSYYSGSVTTSWEVIQYV